MLFFLRALSLFLAWMPEAVCRVLAFGLGELVFWGIPRRRRSVLSNLSHAFPEKPHAWLVRMGRRSLHRMLETGLLAIVYPQLSPARIRCMARPGDSLNATLSNLCKSGRPAVFAIPHMGAWELCSAIPALYEGRLPGMGAVYRPLRNKALDDWVRGARERFGVRMLSRKEGFNEGMQILRNKGVFAILFDQNARDSGVLSLFLDRVCSTTNLPGLMVAKFDARLAIFHTRRRAFWRYDLELVFKDDVRSDAGAVTAELNRWLESSLRADEDLSATWLWVHNRWKTQIEPRVRFRLEHKRSILPPAQNLPRRTRFFVRLPDAMDLALRAVPLLAALRKSRPDAAISVLADQAVSEVIESHGIADSTIELPRGRTARLQFAWRLRRGFPDCWIVLSEDTGADLEAWLSRCPQRFGIERAGRPRPRLTHRWRVPEALDSPEARIETIWEAFFRDHGMTGDLVLEPATSRSAE